MPRDQTIQTMKTLPLSLDADRNVLWPSDMAVMLGGEGLLRLSLEAACVELGIPRVVEDADGRGHRHAGSMLLTLLVYAYARGILAAADVVSACVTDGGARYLCGERVPSVQTLLQFRRRHRGAVQAGLERLFRLVWGELRREGGAGGWFWGGEPDWAGEAFGRVRRAVRFDSMLLDD